MNIDVKQIALDIMRDIHGSSRRLTLYPLGHPITQETLKKPLGGLNNIFAFKHSFIFELFHDRILAEGILLDDTIFVTGIGLEMKRHKLANVIFHSDITIGDLYHFLSNLSSKPGPFEDNFSRQLKAKSVITIDVNSQSLAKIYNYDGSDRLGEKQFLLRNRINDIIAEKPGIIASYYMGRLTSDEDVAKELGVDFRLSFLTKYFREVLLHLDHEKALELIEQALLSTSWLDDSLDSQAIEGLRRLFDDYLSENSSEIVLSSIYRLLKKVGAPESIQNQVLNKSSFLKLKTFQESESIVEILKYSDPAKIDPAMLKRTIFKLAASHQRIFLQDLLDQLIQSLSAHSLVQRQMALNLVSVASEVLANGGFTDEFNQICKESVKLSLMPIQSTEPVELMANLIRLAIRNCRWEEFKVLARTLKGVCEDKFQSESKRALAATKLSEISSSDALYNIASSLSEANKTDDTSDFFEGLGSLGSKDIIKMLAGKLTHPDINIRSRMVKLLASMKKDAGDVLIEKLQEMIKRINGGTINEQDWYYFRNIFRVLKDVRAEQAIPYLEIMASWPDSRLRLELVKTLESMPPEGASKLLNRLASDESLEIKKAAIIAMGLSGDPCMVPYLHEIFMKDRICRNIAVASLGRIGDPRARDILINLFESQSIYNELNMTKREADEIKITILKSLAVIGDEVSLKKLEEFSESSADKSLFKGDLVSNTAKIILAGKR